MSTTPREHEAAEAAATTVEKAQEAEPVYSADKSEDFYAFVPKEKEYAEFATVIHDAMEGFFGWIERVAGPSDEPPKEGEEGEKKEGDEKEAGDEKQKQVEAEAAAEPAAPAEPVKRPKRLHHVPRAIPVFMLEKVQQKIFALLDALDYERNQLAQLFIELDTDFDWQLDTEEFKTLLSTINSSMTDKELAFSLRAVNPNSDPLKPVSLVDVLEWWWQLSVTPKGKAQFTDMHKSTRRYFMLRSVKKVATDLVGDPELFKKLSYLPEEQLAEMLIKLDKVLYDLRVWKAQKLSFEMIYNERTALRYAVHAEWEEEELKAIVYAWDKVVGTGTLPRAKLTEFCALFDYDMTAGTIRMTRKLYPEQFDLQTFLDWWACRPHVGKAAGSAMGFKESLGIAGKSFSIKRNKL